ncbi:MAG: ferrous iron transport protein A [Lachnospiraceae bacterium]|nr:ferrous iron transport protein A [Lachnospiraceae bacterium]
MLPLIFADEGEENIIARIGGSPETRQHLADMGFVPGSSATVVSSNGGNLIVKVKDSRIAISKEMASKIMI